MGHRSAEVQYVFGDFALDPDRRELTRNNEVVAIGPKVFDLLLYLVQNSGAVLEKERLMDAVWPDAVVEENNLSKNISTLRRIFGESPSSPGLIGTRSSFCPDSVLKTLSCFDAGALMLHRPLPRAKGRGNAGGAADYATETTH